MLVLNYIIFIISVILRREKSRPQAIFLGNSERK